MGKIEMGRSFSPRVSVVIPMHNSEPFIIGTLHSILRENDVPIEIVVINDKSTDQSLERVLSIRDERIHIVDGPGTGISSCLNTGIAAAKGDIIMRCDADDQYPAGRIKEQVAWLDAYPEYAAVCGAFSTMDTAGRLVAEMATGQLIEEITGELNSGKTRTHFCTYAVRRAALYSVGGFRPYFVTAEDVDFQLRLGEVANIMYLPRPFYMYRLHEASITHTQGNTKRVFFENTARQFQSQRKMTGQDDLQKGAPPQPPDVQSDKPGTAAQQIKGILTGAAWNEHSAGSRLKAVALGCRAIRQAPFDLDLWRGLLALLIKSTKK